MAIDNYSKGSEWRKWDLHIHTKGTLKNDQFKSETFDKFCVILFQKALEKEIAAIEYTRDRHLFLLENINSNNDCTSLIIQ